MELTEGEKQLKAEFARRGINLLGLNEQERQINDDYEWVLHDAEVQRKYAGKVVVVHKRKVWGAGKNHDTAMRAALRRRGFPRRQPLAMVYVEGVPLPGNAK